MTRREQLDSSLGLVPLYQPVTRCLVTPKSFPGVTAPWLKTIMGGGAQLSGPRSQQLGTHALAQGRGTRQSASSGRCSAPPHRCPCVTHAQGTPRAHTSTIRLHEVKAAEAPRQGRFQERLTLTPGSAPHVSTHRKWAGSMGWGAGLLSACLSDLAPVRARDSVLGVACLCPVRAPRLHHMSLPQCVPALPPRVCFVSSWTPSPSPVFSKTPSLTPHLCPRAQEAGTTNPGALRSSLSAQP